MAPPFISFLSDYGLSDVFVGICHAVIAGICPEARVVDLTHGVPRQDARTGAIVLAAALPYLPVGVHLAVVDPDVGAQRRAVALACADGRQLVGPDNGLLVPAAAAAGGIREAVDIGGSPLRRHPVSATFHGRDIFAPVAAHLAAGTTLAQAGTPIDPAELVALELPVARREGDALLATVRYVDHFGNLQLNAGHDDLAGTALRLGRRARLRLPDGAEHEARYVRTFADGRPGELLLLEDADSRLSIAVELGSAAERLGLGIDAELQITST